MAIDLKEAFEKWKISPLNKLWNYMAYPAFVGGGEATLATIEPTLRRALEALENIENGDCQKAKKNEKCDHGTFSWSYCEACVINVTTPAIRELKQLLGDDDAK